MVKYKLIKKYPGSPELGYVVIKETLNWSQLKDYPEFWEEVVEKDYLITGYYQKPDNIHINPFGNFSKGFETDYEIYQVKRLSDGEIFTIGDFANSDDFTSNSYPIKYFKISNEENTILISCYNHRNGSGYYNVRLKNIKKAKQKLFTTEDGVDIFEGNNFYSTRKNCSGSIIKYKGNSLEIASTKCKEFVDFSTKEKAEEYILMNKPCLSLTDVWDNLKVKDQKEVMKFVKSKLNK